jgi:hypothetical protein
LDADSSGCFVRGICCIISMISAGPLPILCKLWRTVQAPTYLQTRLLGRGLWHPCKPLLCQPKYQHKHFGAQAVPLCVCDSVEFCDW